jgi:hypothetical protein
MAAVHLVTDLKVPSREVRRANRIREGNLDIGMLREQLRQARVVVDDSRVPVLDLCDPELDAAKTTLEEALHAMTGAAERVARLDRKRRKQIAKDARDALAAAEAPAS